MKTGKTLVLMTILALAGVASIVTQRTEDARAAATQPFGGTILETVVCDCTGNFWLRVGPPVQAAVVYQPGVSKLYDYGQIFRSNVNVLGTYVPGGSCNYNPPDCPAKDVTGTIVTVGTSK